LETAALGLRPSVGLRRLNLSPKGDIRRRRWPPKAANSIRRAPAGGADYLSDSAEDINTIEDESPIDDQGHGTHR
jgi:hypothetical protein